MLLKSLLSFALPVILALGCGQSPAPASSVVATYSMKSVYQLFYGGDAVSRGRAVAQTAKLPILSYYQGLLSKASNDPIEINGVTITGSANRLKAAESSYQTLAQEYATVGDYWRASGSDLTTTLSLADFTKAVQSRLSLVAPQAELGLAAPNDPNWNPWDMPTNCDLTQIEPTVSPDLAALPPGSVIADFSNGSVGMDGGKQSAMVAYLRNFDAVMADVPTDRGGSKEVNYSAIPNTYLQKTGDSNSRFGVSYSVHATKLPIDSKCSRYINIKKDANGQSTVEMNAKSRGPVSGSYDSF